MYIPPSKHSVSMHEHVRGSPSRTPQTYSKGNAISKAEEARQHSTPTFCNARARTWEATDLHT